MKTTPFKMGRRRPTPGGLRLRARNYLRLSLPTPPTSCDYSPKALSVLANIYGNDELGDCVIAAGYHVVGVETGNAGALYTAPEAAIIKDYSAIGGYVPGDPSTDNGCNETTALNYWVSKGFANGTKPLAWLEINGADETELKACMYLFENLIFTLELPDAYVNPFPSGSGFTWDVAGAPVPENGHAIMSCGYKPNASMICTWGMIGELTFAAIAKYCVESAGGGVYVLLTPDQLTKGQTKAPNGVAWSNLISDFDSIGGHVPVPPTPPSPVPLPPTPVPKLVTLAQAQAWALSKLQTSHLLLTRAQAELAVTSGLAANWPKT